MSSQLNLFADPAPAAVMRAIPADIESAGDVAEPSLHLPQGIRLGASTWAYPEVKEAERHGNSPVAGPNENALDTLSSHPLLRTMGLERPHFVPFTEADFRSCAQHVAPDFRFLVKAPRLVTAPRQADRKEPNPAFLDPRIATDLFVDPCLSGLRSSAGPLIFQFPRLGRTFVKDSDDFADRLARFLQGLPVGPVYAIEFRDRELLTAQVMRALASVGARLCLCVHARMPTLPIQVAAATFLGTGPLIIRWYLHAGEPRDGAVPVPVSRNRLVDENPKTRATIARLCRENAGRGEDSWVIASHDAEQSAIPLLLRLARTVAEDAA